MMCLSDIYEVNQKNMFLVYIELQKHECKFRRIRNAVGTRADRLVFPQCFRALLNFHECFKLKLNRNRDNKSSISFRKFHDEEKETT